MAIKFYTTLSYKLFCKKVQKHQRKIEVGIDTVPLGTIVNEHDSGFGVFTSDGKFVESSRQLRGKRSQFIPNKPTKNVPYVDKEVVYFGNVYPHFGHFLLEHMNRAWALENKKYQDMPIVLINNYDLKEAPEYIYSLLDLLGVKKENIIILNENTRFRSVHIPHQAFDIPIFYADEFTKPFETMAKRATGKDYDKIYVSRAKLARGKTFGEEAIQKIFELNGFHIIYPETLPLGEQISFMKNCRVLAGCAGTALHLSLFMPKGGTVIQIKRNRENKDNFDVQNLINSAKKMESFYISGSVEKVRSQHSTEMPQIIGLTKYMRAFFNDNNFIYNPELNIPSDKVWQQYTIAMQDFKSRRGVPVVYKIKNLLVKLLACFVPGRENRSRFRKYMKRLLGLS